MATLAVNGAALRYEDNGAAGPAVLFLHGAVTDLRMWNAHRARIGTRWRTVAYTQRYHGTDAWAADGPPYGVPTHSQDLTAFIEALGAGPVHLVAWSYAGHVAFDAALRRPELFRSLYVFEPGVPSYVTDPQAMQAWGEDANLAFGPVFEAIGRGDEVTALKRLLDASAGSPGYFERQSPETRAVELDNAHTLTPLLLKQQPPPQIGAGQLSALRVPVGVAHGSESRPLYALVARAAQQCIAGALHRVVPGHNHMWPDADPEGFADAVLDHLQRC